MAIGYTPRTWVNGSSPALNATNLQAMDDGINAACDALDTPATMAPIVATAVEAGTGTATPNDTDKLGGAKVDHTLLYYTWANLKSVLASAFKHGGSNEIATATPGANAIPKADSGGRLDAWTTGGVATATQTAGRKPLYNAAAGLNANSISFPATQVASADANTLDDYEEGTWTPGVVFGGAAVGVTYSVQTGKYVKVGSKVFLSGYMVLTSKGSSSGSAIITGLPFSTPNDAGNYSAIRFRQSNFSALLQGFVNKNGSNIIIELSATAADATNTDFSNNSGLMFNATYIVV